MLVLYTTCTVAVSSRLQPDYITALVAESQSTHTQRMAEKAQDLAGADQSRSATKGKLEGGLGVTDTVMEEIADDEADWDDIYGTQPSRVKEEAVGEDYGKPSAVEKELGSGAAQPVHGESAVSGAEVQKEADVHMEERPSEGGGTLPLAPKGEHVETQQAQDAERTEDGLPAAMVDQGDELVAGDDANMVSTDEPSTRMIAETSQLESSANTAQPALPSQLAEATIASNNEHAQAETEQEDDPEGQTAWDSDPMHDSSSIDTSDISTDSDSDSDSDDGEPPMTAQRLAKMLLDGDGEDDDGGKTSGQAPRTANEQQERAPPKKDITITPDTKITFLGTVDKYVEGILLIIGSTEANYKVLEPDSALCNEQRDNIGVTSDLLGGANKPMYTLHVSEAEVKDFNLSPGAKIYYVDEHSTFVFVKELEAQKHTDASNMHDEEIAMDEQDFSDDEKEAEYKKANKQNKKAGLGKLTRGAFERGDHQATQQGQDTGAYSGPSPRGGRGRGRGARGGGLPFRGTDSRPAFVNNDGGRAAVNLVLDYGDEDGAPSQPAMDPADGYNLNKRPDNYATMSNTPGPAPTESFNPRGGFNDRGRGDRGRGGDRPRGNRDYRGRGQHQAQPQTRTQQFHQYPESQPLQQFTPQYPPQPQYQQTQQFAPQFQQPQQQQDYAQQYWQQYHQQQQQYGQQQPQPQYGQQQYNPQQYAQQPPRATFPGFPNIPLPVSFPPGFVQGQPYVPPKQEQGDGHGYGAGIKREDQ